MKKRVGYRRCCRLRKIEYTYLGYLVAISLSHIYFAVSVIFGRDTVYVMETQFSWVLLIYPIANLLWFVVHYYGYLDNFSKGFHGLSLLTFFFAGFPFLSSIVQGIAAVVGFKNVPKQYKHVQHLNELYRKKLEEMQQLSNWGMEDEEGKGKQETSNPLQDFLQRDIEQYGDEYTTYLTLDEEEAESVIAQTKTGTNTGVVVTSLAYDVKEKNRRDYDWLIPIYGVQVVEDLSLDELMELASEEDFIQEDEERVTDSGLEELVTESEIEEPVHTGDDLLDTELGDLFLDDLL